METFESGPDVSGNVGVVYHPYDSAEVKKRDGEGLDEEGLPTELAFGRFQGRQLSSHVDFSDMVYPRKGKRVGFVPSQTEFETEDVSEESLLQRFHRLQHEVKQFIIDVEKQKDKKEEEGTGVNLGDLAKQMEFAYGNLVNSAETLTTTTNKTAPGASRRVGTSFPGGFADSSAKVEAEVKQAKQSDGSSSVTYELHYNQSVDREGKRNAEEIVRVERRVASLEQYVGPISASDSCCLEDSVAKLENRSKLFNENELKTIHAHLTRILQDIDEGKLEKQQQAVKIDQLYELLKRREETERQIPVIATRMHALKGLHERSARVVQEIESLNTNQNQLESLLKEDRELLISLRQSLTESARTMDENLQSMRSRVDEYVKRQEEF
eukprot:CAMPEP_0201488540 /NCGR_PEP_ID=MMETSP0151_2-20130828/18806_1 /ASSEMBLY_ACC=CAM_ASM_000257 /TAXON_ID=200890 /ORGANISM="Paramoeba atlantica, Strain 621/1 / CCAP 1560/9" /LENGTH=381 /DNA_ID=CAMNT_0047873855 /DNA_START=57 /DNA_END=1202 /DNA_ORIENTATION=+